MNTNIIRKGDLSFSFVDGEFFCRELASVPQTFDKTYQGDGEFNSAFEEHLELLRRMFEDRCSSKDEYEATKPEDRQARGQAIASEIIDRILEELRQAGPFARLMYFTSFNWWYTNIEIREKLFRITDRERRTYENSAALISRFLVPVLPKQVRDNLVDFDAKNSAANNGHFAILFGKKNDRIRRIVTDTQLFEIRDAEGYSYLDVTPAGKPVARYCTSVGGGRAFFDGFRLMTHDKFQTCAPKTVTFGSCYKVNSTGCSIIDGRLYPLLDTDDKVAQTTGAWMGMVDFSTAEAIEAMKLADASAAQIQLQANGQVTLGDKIIKPLGEFLQSKMTLLDSGFALCDRSEFVEYSNIQYGRVMIVDDSEEWIGKISARIGSLEDGGPEELEVLLTNDKRLALDRIMEFSPDALILDVHLTPDEEFDGLWIANTLFKKGYSGLLLLASGYPDEHLAAMKKLVEDKGRRVKAPGKNPEKIMKALTVYAG